MSKGWTWHAGLLASSPLAHGIQNAAEDTYGDQTGTLLVSTYDRRRERGITMRKGSVHIKDTMRLGQMLLTPIGLMPGILQLACMLKQKVQCHKHFGMHFIAPGRNSQILHQSM